MSRISSGLGFKKRSLVKNLPFTFSPSSLAMVGSRRDFKKIILLSTIFCGKAAISVNRYHFYSEEKLFHQLFFMNSRSIFNTFTWHRSTSSVKSHSIVHLTPWDTQGARAYLSDERRGPVHFFRWPLIRVFGAFLCFLFHGERRPLCIRRRHRRFLWFFCVQNLRPE